MNDAKETAYTVQQALDYKIVNYRTPRMREHKEEAMCLPKEPLK